MRRREFIAGLASTAAWPEITPAQQPAMPLVAFLFSGGSSPAQFASRMRAFREGLAEIGYVEGRNIAFEARAADGQYDRLPALAGDLVRRRVSVIMAQGAPAAAAAKAATTTVPVIFAIGEDPVDLGLVESLGRPGGNVTGVAALNAAVLGKRLELLRELLPQARAVAVLVNPANPSTTVSVRYAQDAARNLGLEVRLFNVDSVSEFEPTFARLASPPTDALLIAPDGLFFSQADRLAALAVKYMIPASHEFREFPVAGGLMSYGGSNTELWRHAGLYTARILKGEKPADLPVVQPTKFEMVINLKAANALRLAIPQAILLQVNELIE
jgi:putative tryptophan/tyrosine transport system substrate-binding protein